MNERIVSLAIQAIFLLAADWCNKKLDREKDMTGPLIVVGFITGSMTLAVNGAIRGATVGVYSLFVSVIIVTLCGAGIGAFYVGISAGLIGKILVYDKKDLSRGGILIGLICAFMDILIFGEIQEIRGWTIASFVIGAALGGITGKFVERYIRRTGWTGYFDFSRIFQSKLLRWTLPNVPENERGYDGRILFAKQHKRDSEPPVNKSGRNQDSGRVSKMKNGWLSGLFGLILVSLTVVLWKKKK